MPVGDDTHAYRTRLPHLVRRDRIYYVTVCTRNREVLPPPLRDVILATVCRFHQILCWIDAFVVMPDHMHLLVVPYEEISPAALIGRMKGRAAYEVNRQTGRSGPLWQRDSFDRIVRSEENLQKKREYIFANPVRAGLVKSSDEYRWCWWSGGL